MPEDCDACGRCSEGCPTGALEIKGQDMSPEELLRELMKDRAFWGQDGGVTLSGGEITLQWQEAEKLLALLHAEGVQTAVDTCGFCGRQALEALLPYTDLFLYDLKLFDEQEHIRFTSRSNRVILDNYRWLAEEAAKGKTRIWVRTPIIPGATDTDENIAGLAGIIKDSAERWELLSFNNLCRDKYDRIKKEWEYSKAELMTAERMQALTELTKRSGCPQTVWSGVTRLKNRSDE